MAAVLLVARLTRPNLTRALDEDTAAVDAAETFASER
jgi:hypothetical protein